MNRLPENERSRLISYLQGASERDYAVGEADPDAVGLMLQYIGDPDPFLRDELIYSALHQWICKLGYIDAGLLSEMLITVTDDNHLFYCIGNNEDDTVFTRTFSSLAVSLILSRHRQSPFLSAEMFAVTKERLLQYYKMERDLRGYVEGRGWAHGAAHGADALDDLARCPECTASVHREILEAVKCMICNGSNLLCHQEDDRIANVIFSIHAAGLVTSAELENWIRGLLASLDEPDYYTRYVSMTNARNLVRSIYFRFLREGCDKGFSIMLVDLENKLHRA
jgi:hypothetical protein